MKLQNRIFALAFTGLFGFFGGCTQVESPKSRPVQYGGACGQEYSQDYERLLNWPAETDNKAVCEEFYSKYPNVKCFSQVDGAELRIHTADFDEACNKKPSDKSKKQKDSTGESKTDSSDSKGICSPELTQFIIDKQTQFQTRLLSLETSNMKDDDVFDMTLGSKKTCSQFFHSYKYSTCVRDQINYSFHDLKPYCDEFQTILHKLRTKNSKKFSPEELKPLAGLSLKFHFQDSLMPFYPSKLKIKDTYVVEGKSLSFSAISSSQSYCFFESEKIRFAGELKNEIYKVDMTTISKNRVAFSHSSFNEQWKMTCQFPDHFYLQDLIEVLGDIVSVFE